MRRLALVGALGALVLTGGCRAVQPTSPQAVTGGDAQRGLAAIEAYGCSSCHVIPGVRTVEESWVGPPLTNYGRRAYVAGVVTNTQEHLQRWLLDPRSVDPLTAMPDVGLTELEALDIAAYLQRLR